MSTPAPCAASPRKIQRIDHIFVSHAHIYHFIGFDRLLRLLVGRPKSVHLHGPPGFTDRVFHKLQGYHWNLVDLYRNDLVIIVSELDSQSSIRTIRFRLKNGFAAEEMAAARMSGNVLHSEPTYRVSAAVLEHRTPCLGFALQEAAHVNIWKTRLAERGLSVGPWLRDLKRAVIEKYPDDHVIRVDAGSADSQRIPLGQLRDVLTITSGQKIAYITDVADTLANRKAIIDLVGDADVLFIEAAFARADAALAAERAHLTTEAAGQIAREARVRRVEPFHFSPRYAGEEKRMLSDVLAAFAGPPAETTRDVLKGS